MQKVDNNNFIALQILNPTLSNQPNTFCKKKKKCCKKYKKGKRCGRCPGR
ncbi:MAG: hypothetical protein AB8G11_18225 [Saprospiraceae bacterium]